MPTRDLSALFGATINYTGVPSKAFPFDDDGEGGKTYKVPSPDAATGARFTAEAALGLKLARGEELTDDEQASLQLDDEQEQTFYREILGPVYDEMLADGVAWTTIVSIARDAYLVITDNQPLADASLAAQGNAEARENRATRRAAAKSSKSAKPRVSKPRAGSKSSPASSAPAPTKPAASTRSPATSASSPQPAAKAG